MKKISRHQGKRRVRLDRTIAGAFFLGFVVLTFFIFIGRFIYIAASGHVGSVNLTHRTEQKYSQITTLKAKRGQIFDSNGNILAEDANSYKIYAVLSKNYVSSKGKPLYVTHKKQLAKVLAKYLNLSTQQVLAYLNPANKKAFQVEFGSAGRNLSYETKQAIESQNLQGVYFTEAPSRLYPNGIFASHTIGIVDQTKSSQTGQTTLAGILGIEKYFNSTLTGKDGVQKIKVDSYGYALPHTQRVLKKSTNGGNVYLTLNFQLQNYLEELMDQVDTKYDPVNLNAVLMDAKTGAILALSQRPTFNPDNRSQSISLWRDTLVQDAYEPGSVFKLLTIAAAIDSGNYHPNATYLSGSVNIKGTKINDWDTAGWGRIPFYEAVPRSSNTGLSIIEQTMGAKTWLKYLNRFKVAKKTGITLPGEVSGSLQFQTPLNQAITSFGQGVDVNVMQMMQYLTTFANKGTELKPYLVKKIVKNGHTTSYHRTVVAHPITSSTAKQVLSLMHDVVYKSYGTGQVYQIPGYQIAAKTGTAQITGSNGSYLTGSNNYIFSVAGMAPAQNPRYILYVTMQQPQKMTDSAEKILAQIFNPLMKRVLDLDKISDQVTDNSITMPDVTGQSLATASSSLTGQNLKVAQVGTGQTVVQQLPLAKAKVLTHQRVILLTNGAMTMPNVSGWSKNDVLKLAQITGITAKFTGSGYVTKQSLSQGSLLTTNSTLQVTLGEKP